MKVLNPRETATAIWMVISLFALLWRKSTRGSAWGVVEAFFAWKILRWWLAMVTYICAFVFLFSRLGLWAPDLLKDAVFYIVFSASVTFFKANHISEEKNFFREMLKDNLKLGIIVEFLTGEFTFGFWTEFLFVPVAVLLAGMQTFTGKDEKYAKLNRLINWIWVIILLSVIYHVSQAVALHTKDLLSIDKFRQILLTPNLTLIYIPFLYVLSLHMVYETQFTLLSFKIRDKQLLKFARRRAMLHFRLDLDGLKRWVNRWNLSAPQTEGEVVHQIRELKTQQQLEDSPPIILPEDGWSPYAAKNFLPDEKLKTGFYNPGYENEWSAVSGYLQLDNNWSGNSISYYVIGERLAAHRLELVLKAATPKEQPNLLTEFLKRIAVLYSEATGTNLPSKIADQIKKARAAKFQQGLYSITLEKECWLNINHGYDLIFSISMAKFDTAT